MKKIKIALVSPYPPSKGTLNEYAYHLVKHFLQKDEIAELVLITDKLNGGQQYEVAASNVQVSVEEAWSFNSITNTYNIWKTVRKHRPDIVFYNIHFLSFGDRKIAAALGLLSPWVTRLSGFKSAVLLHNIVECVDLTSAGITQNRFFKWIYSLIGTILTWCLLRSNMLAVTIPKYLKILEKKYKTNNICYVPHGSFQRPEKPEFSLPEGPMKVMTFGKFGTYKKVEEMIRAVELVRQRTGQDIEIVIAGTDSPNSKGYLGQVKETFKNTPDITYTGYVAEEDVPDLFKRSAVVVFPYTSTTGSSGVLHQAGSYAKACVLPNIGDFKSLIEEEGYKGEYFIPGNEYSMADAIQKLLTDEKRRNDIGAINYAAAASLPMSDITDWYMLHFQYLLGQKVGGKNVSSIFSKDKPPLALKASQLVRA